MRTCRTSCGIRKDTREDQTGTAASLWGREAQRSGAGSLPPGRCSGAAFLGVCRVPCWAGGTPAAEESARRSVDSRVQFKWWGAAVR